MGCEVSHPTRYAQNIFYGELFFPYYLLTTGAKDRIDTQTLTVRSVDLCIEVLFCSFCKYKESMYYGKCNGSENTCKTDDQE